jgi:hypothetical protein
VALFVLSISWDQIPFLRNLVGFSSFATDNDEIFSERLLALSDWNDISPHRTKEANEPTDLAYLAQLAGRAIQNSWES